MPKNKLTATEVEVAINQSLAGSPNGSASIDKVLKLLGNLRSQPARRKVQQVIDGDPRLFSNDKGEFQLRNAFFQNREFLIVPDEWEIDQGILLPGHRFSPFVNSEIFPSEIILKGPAGEPVPSQVITAPLSQVMPYHLLLGSEQVFDFLVADSPSNIGLRNLAKTDATVTLNVYNLKEFYRKNQFSLGDALLCKIMDYDQGIIEFQYLSGENRLESQLKSYTKLFEDALIKVIDRFENYLEIPEQLSWAYYLGVDFLPPVENSASADEFLVRTSRIEIQLEQGCSTLVTKENSTPDDSLTLPDGVTFSRGNTSDMLSLLKEVGSSLRLEEIDGFILDNCYARELDFEDFFARAFGRGKLNFADEGQQAVFLNYIEDRFEELTGTYNRGDDEIKAPLRATVMELVEDRMSFLDFLASNYPESDDLPQDGIHQLATIAMKLSEILKLLNDPGFTPNETDLRRLTEAVELLTDDQEDLLDKLVACDPGCCSGQDEGGCEHEHDGCDCDCTESHPTKSSSSSSTQRHRKK